MATRKKMTQSYGKSSIQGYKTLAIPTHKRKNNYIIMEAIFTGTSRITVGKEGADNVLMTVELALEVGPGLDHDKYKDPVTGMLTGAGCRTAVTVFIHGLAMAVKLGQEGGFFTLEDVKKLLIAELERSVGANASMELRPFKKN